MDRPASTCFGSGCRSCPSTARPRQLVPRLPATGSQSLLFSPADVRRPSQRFTSLNKPVGLSKNRPQRALTEPKHKTGGRNAYGRLTSRRMGGGHKQLYRVIDFKRNILDIPATVEAIEYDPNRSAHIALLAYTNGVKRYIPAPEGLKAGDKVVSSNAATTNDFTVGNCFPLSIIPFSTRVHCVEMVPGKGAQMGRSAGASIELVGVEQGNAQLKMP